MNNATSTNEYHGEHGHKMLELKLKREVDNGIIFISSEEVDDLFLALKDSSDSAEIRKSIDGVLRAAYSQDAQVFTNGKIDGPIIDVVVKLKN